MGKKVIVAVYEGVGGPETAVMGSDGFEAGATDAGSYVVAYCGKHSSRRYPHWSRIRWGTPLKEEKGKLYVKHERHWKPISDFTTASKDDILEYHEDLYGVRKLPSKWVFNDFGSSTCYVFKDHNKNRKLDGKERVHGEFFHTTPPNEAETALGDPVILTESHGCVHVKPVDITEMRKKGYFRSGNLVHVHKYSESAPTAPKGPGKSPYELHFYPGDRKIVVKGVKR